MKLTFIGNGNMAKALIEGLVSNYDIEVLGRNEKTLQTLKNKLPKITTKVIGKSEDITGKNIVLCVKPYSLPDLAPKLSGEADTIFSVLAGTSIDSIRAQIKSKKYIRTMPNLGASFLKSMTTITGDEELKETALEIFNNIGTALWLSTENELDIATGVAGSGPAYLALIAESLADGAVNQGLKREDSQILVQGLFDGFAALIANENPALIKDGVMSPGGTTAAGYAALERCNVRHGMMEAISDAYSKAKELKLKN
ncbi:pyrroline-5-carboxylate reductase [Candidatus Sulfurimonas marisnigri]|uniref:Pyrroline-5-carboxylate reductase n=1 Tax=Candidatus Sulfurimonas marisnigri TaxID=2740405 RepID=A0A7S7M1Y6_9BACT|nr:pyrroline-5-carboxylate reductase [Candidatus Sulfurimonas marisnigri]QOY55637.1 pyrroline-5-carboxylate reductase [Candidatus Sulfurimonas marisnigri]